MKAITLTQPWSTLVAHGFKTIETRSWSTKYRGWLAIHAAKRFPKEAHYHCDHEPFRSSLHACGYRLFIALPVGCVLAKVHLIDCIEIPQHRTMYFSTDHASIFIPPGEPEFSFGDYTPGRFAWIFGSIVHFPKPIPARGALGLWEWHQP